MDEGKLLKFLTELAELYKRHDLGIETYACDIAEVKPYSPEYITDLAHDNGLGDALDYLLEQEVTSKD